MLFKRLVNCCVITIGNSKTAFKYFFKCAKLFFRFFLKLIFLQVSLLNPIMPRFIAATYVTRCDSRKNLSQTKLTKTKQKQQQQQPPTKNRFARLSSTFVFDHENFYFFLFIFSSRVLTPICVYLFFSIRLLSLTKERELSFSYRDPVVYFVSRCNAAVFKSTFSQFSNWACLRICV